MQNVWHAFYVKHIHTQQFYVYYLCLLPHRVQNWSIFLEQSFTACIPSLGWQQVEHLEQEAAKDATVLNSVTYIAFMPQFDAETLARCHYVPDISKSLMKVKHLPQ